MRRYLRLKADVGNPLPTVPLPSWICISPTRERENPLALPTLDMYLPLSKLESIRWVSTDATYNVTSL